MDILELSPQDFSAIREWIDPSVFRIFHAPIDDEQLHVLLTQHKNGKIANLGLKAVNDAGQPIGLVHVAFDWTNDLGHIRQILVPSRLRRRGVGRALMQEVLRIGFGEHGLHRIQLFTDQDNESAVAFYRNQGFHMDGLMREAWKVGDRHISWYCLSMLKREYEAFTAAAPDRQ